MAFLNPIVNSHFKIILNVWAEFLVSPASTSGLTDKEWFSQAGLDGMQKAAGKPFQECFRCTPSLPHWGFTSWDNFFVREFRDGARPVASPDDLDVVVSACESGPFRIEKDVKLLDKFWVKAQPYSLFHIFKDRPETAQEFVGGTIYQAFLSALSYHRWHSPVDGEVIGVQHIEGSYYSVALSEGFDLAGPNMSQGYISEVAARAIILIQADNPKIGKMAFVAIGMAEVSSNDVFVSVGQRIKKGEPLGTFHFGGSTHLLIFKKEVQIDFQLVDVDGKPVTPGLEATNVPINSHLATVKN